MMRIKLCGLTQLDQLKMADAAGVDYLGLIFHPESPRYAVSKLESALVRELSVKAKRTGVFLNADQEQVDKAVAEWGLSALQFHGDESPAYCRHFLPRAEVFKVISIPEQANTQALQQEIDEYAGCVHAFLFDTQHGSQRGGTGKAFNWSVIEPLKMAHPFLLSGGVGMEHAKAVATFNHIACLGVDINSRFEIEPGVKDMEMVNFFIADIKQRHAHSGSHGA